MLRQISCLASIRKVKIGTRTIKKAKKYITRLSKIFQSVFHTFRFMKNFLHILFLALILMSCSSSKDSAPDIIAPEIEADSQVEIEDRESEFRLVIFDPKFNGWLSGYAKPRGYYSQSYLEEKNRLFVIEWNIRAGQPQLYDSKLYDFTIDYDSKEDYGFEVNYLLYNYFMFFQSTYNQKL